MSNKRNNKNNKGTKPANAGNERDFNREIKRKAIIESVKKRNLASKLPYTNVEEIAEKHGMNKVVVFYMATYLFLSEAPFNRDMLHSLKENVKKVLSNKNKKNLCGTISSEGLYLEKDFCMGCGKHDRMYIILNANGNQFILCDKCVQHFGQLMEATTVLKVSTNKLE